MADEHQSEIILSVSEDIYTREALLRTCYWFTDRCYLFVRRGARSFNVHVTAKTGNPADLRTISGEFQNALLDHQLRHDIERETGKIRELLVAKAIAEAGSLDDPPPGDPRDPVAERHSSDALVRITTP